MPREAFIGAVPDLLTEIQAGLLQRALAFREANTRHIEKADEFRDFFTPQNPEKPEAHGGFALSPWCGHADCEKKINDALSVTVRCMPLDHPPQAGGTCVGCGGPGARRVIFAKSY